MLFGQSRECRKWCWMSIFVIVAFFQLGPSFTIWGALTQKRLFLVISTTFISDFFWKKQTFNTKFVTWHSVQMTWTGHKKKFWGSQDVHRRTIKPTVDSADSEQIVQHFCYNIWNKCEIYVSVEKNPETPLLVGIWTTQG